MTFVGNAGFEPCTPTKANHRLIHAQGREGAVMCSPTLTQFTDCSNDLERRLVRGTSSRRLLGGVLKMQKPNNLLESAMYERAMSDLREQCCCNAHRIPYQSHVSDKCRSLHAVAICAFPHSLAASVADAMLYDNGQHDPHFARSHWTPWSAAVSLQFCVWVKVLSQTPSRVSPNGACCDLSNISVLRAASTSMHTFCLANKFVCTTSRSSRGPANRQNMSPAFTSARVVRLHGPGT